MLLLAIVLAPLLECFDRWDAPGLGNDTEMAAFCFVLLLCLLLAACRLIRHVSDHIRIELVPMEWPEPIPLLYELSGFSAEIVPPPILVSLRI